ncbi:hypothetical protein [uncultured Rhodoferax sp.]|uniref:hypothetical protein n=1 Tax=uncultured Rhodoferax sp. TaxID=223188 RepID=UPI0025E624E8|nr:hypothetical protein [uncultured Rhodoferax sp.]
MRSIHIYCDGGFGNRFNGLIAGLALAKAAGLAPIVVWPRNNWCGASYEELIATPATVIERELASYVPEKDRYQFFMTEDHLGMGVANQSPLQTASLDEALHYLAGSDKDVYFHTPLIPAFLEPALVYPEVQALQFQPALLAQVQAFMAQHQLTEFFGIHIRKTDFGANASDDVNLYQLVRDVPHKRFFVCSDDKDVEARFGALPNVVMYPKRAYVEKLVDGGWNTPTADHSGRVYACNVNRSALSVEDAIIDLLLLSYSQIVSTSNSTFRNTALLLQNVRRVASAAAA